MRQDILSFSPSLSFSNSLAGHGDRRREGGTDQNTAEAATLFFSFSFLFAVDFTLRTHSPSANTARRKKTNMKFESAAGSSFNPFLFSYKALYVYT